MDPKQITKETKAAMTKATDYLKSELKGIRTGRATTALIEYVKVEYYGSMTDLKSLAALSVPEATTIMVQPFDPQSVGDIKKGIEAADLGLNPIVDGKIIRVSVPSLSGDRREQLCAQAKRNGEEAKVTCRNARRDANKQADALAKDKSVTISEDEVADLKDSIQELLKAAEGEIDAMVEQKVKDIRTV